jgi:transmembrane sensor
MRTQDKIGRDEQAWEALDAVRDCPEVQEWLSAADARHTRRKLRARRWFLAASISAVTVALAAAAYLHFSFSRYETQIGEQRDLVLADGSRVTLNTNTAIAVRYSASRRFIEIMRGEAFFSVQHDASRPFDVVAHGLLTRALGTEFNVDLRETNVTVSVLEGAVRITPPSSVISGPLVPTAIGKGQALEFETGEHRVREQQADRRRIDGWRSRRLEFSDTPLKQAVEEFNRYSTTQVILGTPTLGSVRISGVFRIGDTEGFLFSLREALHVETHETQGGVVLISNPADEAL